MNDKIRPHILYGETYHFLDGDYVRSELELMQNDGACILIKNMAIVKDINKIHLDNFGEYINSPQEKKDCANMNVSKLDFSLVNEMDSVKWGVLGTFKNSNDMLSEMDYKGYLDLVIKYKKEIYFSIYNKNSLIGCINRMGFQNIIYEENLLLINIINADSINELVFSKLNNLFDYENCLWKNSNLFIEY